MNQYIMGNKKEVEKTRINKEKQQQQKPPETTNKKVTAKETHNKMKKVESKKEEDKNKNRNKNKNEEIKKTVNKYKKYWVKYAERSKMKKIEIEIENSVANENSSQCGECNEGCDTARINPDRRCTHVQTVKWPSDERLAAVTKPDTRQESESSQVKPDTRPGLKSFDLNEKF